MKKAVLLILLLICCKGLAQDVATKIQLFETDLNHWDKTKARKWSLLERMQFYEVNAVSIAVIRDYKVEWIKAYGFSDVSEQKPATTATLFQAASISKSINSLAILRLVEEGKLKLDTDINDYLSDWKFPYDANSKQKKITISHLLSHQGGLSTSGFPGYAKGLALPTTIQILDGLKPANSGAVRSIFEPGSKIQYSGGGTTITQLILENTTGSEYEDYLRKNVLEKLEMNSSSYNQPPLQEMENLRSAAYSGRGKEVVGKYHIYPEQAAAGLWTNPADLAKYIIDTQLSLIGKGNKILSKGMSTKRLDEQLGVFIQNFDGVKYFGHSGRNEGFVCDYFASFEGGNGIVIMTNSDSGKIIGEIMASIASLNKWKNFPLSPLKESIARTIRKKVVSNVDDGISYFRDLKKNHFVSYDFSDEDELNMLGYELLRDGQVDAALKIFDLNVTEFPKSSNVYDSRGEAYFVKKEYQLSKQDYQKSLDLDPGNDNALTMLSRIVESQK